MSAWTKGDLEAVVGRESELSAVDRALAEVERGRGHFVTIFGEPGIGKSRLADEVCRRAAERNFGVVRGRAAEFERDIPLALWVDALDPYFSGLDDEDLDLLPRDRVAEFATVLPALARIDPVVTTALKVERYRLHHAARAIFEEIAATSPLVLVLDDVHWADEASVELLAHLLLRRPRGPVLIVLTYRTGRVARVLESAISVAEREQAVAAIEPAPLSREHAEHLIGDDLDPELREAIYRECGGNPFYLGELARVARAAGDRRLPTERSADVRNLGVPSLVEFAIGAELSALSPAARDLARGAAFAWEPFDPELAAWVADVEDAAAVPALDELIAADIVRPARPDAAYMEFTGPSRFAFRHPIVRRAVYQGTGEGSRVAAHRRAGELFAKRGAPVALLAHHLERSAAVGDGEAIAKLEQAGHDALQRAPAAAARWFAAALRLLDGRAPVERRLRVLRPLATALWLSGQVVECRRRLEELLALAGPGPDGERVQTLAMMARVDRVLGDARNARALLSGALAEATDDADAIALRLELSVDHWFAGEWDRMLDLAGAAHDAAVRLDLRTLRAFAAALVALAQTERGELRAALTFADEASSLVEALSNDALAERVELFTYLGRVLVVCGLHRTAVELLGRGAAIVRATGQDIFFVPLLAELGRAQLRLGELAEAAETADTALDASSLLPDGRARAQALILRAVVELRRGRLQHAVETCKEAVDAAAGSPRLVTAASIWLGCASIEAGAPEEGRAQILEHAGGPDLVKLGAQLRPFVRVRLAEAELALGAVDEAERSVLAAEAEATGLGLAERLADARTGRAMVQLARGDAEDAARAASDAAARYRSVDQTIDAARADTLTGRALAAAGERERAVELLEDAYRTLADRGAERYRDAAALELRALGRRMKRGNPRNGRHRTGLTERELAVAELAAMGHTNRRIAGQLFLSEKTVETHLSHIFEKLGVPSRAAIARALQQHDGD